METPPGQTMVLVASRGWDNALSKTETVDGTSSCDWQCYLDNYGDLQKAFGTCLTCAEKHYSSHGKAEGRNCNCKTSVGTNR